MMKHQFSLSVALLVCGLALLPETPTSAAEPGVPTSPLPVFATGQSALADPRAAAAAAAAKAKAVLGAETPKLVIVFCAKPQFGAEVVDGVGTVFDKKIIYGCETASPITQEGNFTDQGADIPHGIAVMAIGGDCTVTPAAAQIAPFAKGELPKALHDDGKTIGDALKTAYESSDPGKLLITFGSQHAGDNISFAKGLAEALDKDGNIKMIGGASGAPGTRQIVQGEAVKGTNIAILITGKFTVVTGSTKDKSTKAAGDLLQTVLSGSNGKASMVFFFEDHYRRREMVKAGNFAEEFSAISNSSAGSPIFGMYDSGEIGPDTPGSIPAGLVMRAVVGAILPQ